MQQLKINPLGRLAVFVALLWLLPGAQIASAQTKVSIVNLIVSSSHLPLWIAHEQGLFAKHGIAYSGQDDRRFRCSVTADSDRDRHCRSFPESWFYWLRINALAASAPGDSTMLPNRNWRSRATGITGHAGPEYAPVAMLVHVPTCGQARASGNTDRARRPRARKARATVRKPVEVGRLD